MAFALPKGFKVREGVELSGGTLPRAVARIIEYAEKMKFQEVMTTFQICQALGYRDIKGMSTHPALAANRHKITGQQVIWGSRRTIAELKKQLEKM